MHVYLHKGIKTHGDAYNLPDRGATCNRRVKAN